MPPSWPQRSPGDDGDPVVAEEHFERISGCLVPDIEVNSTVSHAVDDHGDDIDTATAIEVETPVAGIVDYGGDVDLFRFTAAAGQLYRIDVALGTLDYFAAILRDSDGDDAQRGDPRVSGIFWETPIFWEAPDSGDYYVEVRANSAGSTGTYTLTVSQSDIQDDHGNDIETATAIEVETTVGGIVDFRGDVDFFHFTATAGQLYQIDIALGTLADSRTILRNSDWWELASSYGDSLGSSISWVAPDSGDYYVEVSSWGGSTGSYTLTVSLSDIQDDHGNDIETATAMEMETTVGGIVDYGGDVDLFRFTAAAGQLYVIDVELGTLEDSTAILRNSDGSELASSYGDSGASRIVWEAPDSGDYYVAVRDNWSGSIGSYTLTISLSDIQDDHGNGIETATAIEVETTVGGIVDYEGDVDLFRFTAAAGQLYQIDVALGTLDYSEASLHDSDGWWLTSSDFWEAPDSGNYYVAVSDNWGGSTGSYTLTISLSDIQDDHGDDFGTATAIEVETAVGGIVDYRGDVDFFRFTATAGQLYQIDVELGTLDDSTAILLNSDGLELTSNGSRILWESPDSGDYYVEVLSWGGTGSYTLTVSLSDIQDDHGNNIETATAIEMETAVGGIVGYGGDVDLFRFTATAGQLYQIDVSLGTLDDSVASLRDSEGWQLTSSYGDSSAPRIVWEAPDSGDYYVEVTGWGGTGSYILTVTPR